MGQRDADTRPGGGLFADLIVGASLILLLAPAGAFIYFTWDAIGRSLRYAYFPFENWLFFVELFVIALQVLALGYAFEVVRRDLPRLAAAVVVSLYLGIAYAVGADWLGLDETWRGAVGLAMGVAGYFIGKHLSVRRPFGDGLRTLGVELCLSAVGVGLLQFGQRIELPDGAPSWAHDGLIGSGVVLVCIGLCALFGRFPRTVTVAGLTGAVLFAAFPGG